MKSCGIMKRAAANTDATLAFDELVLRDRSHISADEEARALQIEETAAGELMLKDYDCKTSDGSEHHGVDLHPKEQGEASFSSIEARRYEVKIRSTQGFSSPPAYSKWQTDDTQGTLAEKARVENKRRNEQKLGSATGW